MHRLIIKTLVLLVLLTPLSSLSCEYGLKSFDSLLSVPSGYVINPKKYGNNVSIRLQNIRTADEFSEIIIFDQSVCDGDCKNLILSIEVLEIKNKYHHNGIEVVEFVGRPNTGIQSVVYLYDEDELIKVTNDLEMILNWLETISHK